MELNRVGGGYGTRVSPKAAGIPRNGWSRYIDRTGSWVQPLLVQLAFSHHRKYLIKRGRIYVNVNTNLKLENFSFIYGESFLIFHSLKQDFSTKIVESAAPTVSQSAFWSSIPKSACSLSPPPFCFCISTFWFCVRRWELETYDGGGGRGEFAIDHQQIYRFYTNVHVYVCTFILIGIPRFVCPFPPLASENGSPMDVGRGGRSEEGRASNV